MAPTDIDQRVGCGTGQSSKAMSMRQCGRTCCGKEAYAVHWQPQRGLWSHLRLSPAL